MGKIRRFFQFIVSLAGAVALLFATSLFFHIPNITPFVERNVLRSELTSQIVAFVLCLLFIFIVIRFFQSIFARSLKSDLILDREEGQLKISKEAVIGLVRSSIANIEGVRASDIRVRFYKQPEDTEIDAEVTVDEKLDLITLGEEIQKAIHDSASLMLGTDIEKINLQLLPANKEEKRVSSSTPEPRRPRVR